MTPGQTWAAFALALIVFGVCWKSEQIDTGVGVFLAVMVLLVVVYLITSGSPA